MRTFCTRCNLPLVWVDDSWGVDWLALRYNVLTDRALFWCAYSKHAPQELSRPQVLLDLVRVVMG